MGGHGGLNILPQKSWNVYGRENRLKVARDEAQHAEEEKIRMEKQREAESQARRIYLLQQAAKKRGEHFELPQAAVGPEPQQLAAQEEALEQSSAGAEDSAVAVRAQEEQPALLQHINFFAEHEARESHPEKLEEAKREARRRGEQKTQTSDAKFDEKFQVGHGLSGEANKPWYAKSGSLLHSEEAAPLQGSAAPALASHQQRTHSLAHSAGLGQTSLPASSGPSEKQQRAAEKAARKEAKRRKHAEKAAHKQKHRSDKLKKGLDIERLRQERRERERVEHERARQAVLGNARAKGIIGDGRRYHGAYGNAAAREAATV